MGKVKEKGVVITSIGNISSYINPEVKQYSEKNIYKDCFCSFLNKNVILISLDGKWEKDDYEEKKENISH